MAEKLTKTQLIEKIIKKHPHYGLGFKLSWYVGGMADSGDWYVAKLLRMKRHKLQEFYDYISNIENNIDTKRVANGASFEKEFIEFNNKVHCTLIEQILVKIADKEAKKGHFILLK